MQKPIEINFRDMEPSPALESVIRERAEKLEKFCPEIIGCRVIVETPHKHSHQGNLFHVRIDLTVPGREIVVKRAPDAHHAHEDAYVTVGDAFDSARRQLEDYARKKRGKVKTHESMASGRVSVLVPEEDFGRLETADGRDIFFHRNSLINAEFDDLSVGAELRFVEEAGEKGPQASTAYLVGKQHPAP